MRIVVSFPTIVLVLLTQWLSSADTKSWRGIVPLRSTRADVEALLGKGTNECKCSYYREDMNIFFVYASGDCDSGGSGNWNIAPNTVIRFTIYPKPNPRLSDLNIIESEFEKREDIGTLLLYVNEKEGFSMEVDQGVVRSFNYGPAAGDEYLRCPDYDGIHYDSSIPRELRPRFLDRLKQYIQYSAARQYENQYELFWREFAAKMFGVENKKEFLRLVRKSGGFEDVFIEFKPKSITVQEDKTYGEVYDVFGLARAWHDARVLESYRTTRMVLKGGELYFVDLFNLIPR